MQLEQVIAFIRTVPIFVSLSDEHLQQVAEATTIRELADHEVLFDRGAETTDLFIVVRGELGAITRDDATGLERELQTLYPGSHFGLLSLLTEERAAVRVKARQPSQLIVLSRSTINDLFGGSPGFGQAVCRSLAWFLRENISSIPAIPFVRIDKFPDIKSTVSLLPPRISRHFKALVLERDDELVRVGMVNPNDTRARDFIQGVLGQFRVEFLAIGEEDFDRNRERLLGSNTSVTFSAESFEDLMFVDSAGRPRPIVETGEHDALQEALTAAIRSGASDIHIEPVGGSGKIRLRLDGKLIPFQEDIRPMVLRQMVSRLKVMAELDITATRTPQEGRFLVTADEQQIEFRESVMPCRGGEKIVLRVVSQKLHLGKLANLFASDTAAALAHELFMQTNGLVLVTGPTGSGKTTTLYAALNMLNAEFPTSNIVTIEDPIEYELGYATQIQVDRHHGMGFPQLLRSVLRQDPDIILVGEIRDKESAAMAVEAASTGHMVLSSLHTHSALESLARLRNLEVPPYLIASALRGIVSQTLVPRLQPGFTEAVAAHDPVIARLVEQGVIEEAMGTKLQRGKTMDEGPVDGESGRVGLFEFLAVNDRLRDQIDRGGTRHDLEEQLTDETFFSFARYGRLLLNNAMVSPERIERALPKRATFAMSP